MSPSGCWGLPVALLALLVCPGGLETSLNKTLLAKETQWEQYAVFGITQNTVLYCYFTCSEKQRFANGTISVFYPPKEVLMMVQPIWVTVGEPFVIECRVPAVAPLEKFTLTLLHGNESLHRQTFEGATTAPQEAMTTYNRTAHREDECYNFSCQAELDLQSRGGKIIRTTSKSQGLKIHEPKQDKQMVIIIVVVSVLLSLFVTSVLLCFAFGQQWNQRRRGSYRVQAAWRRLRRAYRA
ncbi:intercellular adhesion molecule 2 isoform 2-T4 [Glossophaga mutica]